MQIICSKNFGCLEMFPMVVHTINGSNMNTVFVIIRSLSGRDELAVVVVGKIHGNAYTTQVKTSSFVG